jgi:hypothetical protein
MIFALMFASALVAAGGGLSLRRFCTVICTSTVLLCLDRACAKKSEAFRALVCCSLERRPRQQSRRALDARDLSLVGTSAYECRSIGIQRGNDQVT